MYNSNKNTTQISLEDYHTGYACDIGEKDAERERVTFISHIVSFYLICKILYIYDMHFYLKIQTSFLGNFLGSIFKTALCLSYYNSFFGQEKLNPFILEI